MGLYVIKAKPATGAVRYFGQQQQVGWLTEAEAEQRLPELEHDSAWLAGLKRPIVFTVQSITAAQLGDLDVRGVA